MPKIIILMRHAQAAFSAAEDAQRPLTAQGEQQALHTGQVLQQAGFTPQRILCSPLLRAQQSAQLAAAGWDLSPTPALELDGRLSAQGLLDFAYQQLEKEACVMLVGHNPNISLTASLLDGKYYSFRPADCAVFDVTAPTQPQLLFSEFS